MLTKEQKHAVTTFLLSVHVFNESRKAWSESWDCTSTYLVLAEVNWKQKLRWIDGIGNPRRIYWIEAACSAEY